MAETSYTFRKATGDDVLDIVRLLADDGLGSTRENPASPLARPYIEAFSAIDTDPNQLLAVVEDATGLIVGTLQVSFIPGLSRLGSWRGQIEAVRIAKSHRSSGLGQRMFEWAIDQCRNKGCNLVQLTTDKSRPDAHRFYEKLGFEASHIGFKLNL